MGAIPKWGWILLLAVAFDDIILWFSSPILAIPLVILLVVAGAFFYFKPAAAGNLIYNAASTTRASLGKLAVEATTGLIASNRKTI
jgi:hypothetical protein